MPCTSWSAKDHEVDLEILVADTLWSASSVSHITAWLWKKSLNIWVKTETSHLLSSRLAFKRLQYFCLSFLPVSLASSAFRCAYCYFLNPARKMRPQAPKLPEFSFEKRLRTESNTPEPAPRPATDTKENAPPSGGINKHRCAWTDVCLFFIWGLKFIQMLGLWNKKQIKMSFRGDPLRLSCTSVSFLCVLTACVQYIHPSFLCLFDFFSPNLMSDCVLLWLWESAEVRPSFPV